MDFILSPIVDDNGKKSSFRSNNSSPAKPHGKSSSEGKCRVNETIGVVDEISRRWKRNCHLTDGLEDGEHTRADHEEG
jgi:hypothetical protein